MDRTEAEGLLDDLLSEIKRLGYERLVNLVDSSEPQAVVRVIGASGAEYGVEIIIHWDDPRRRTNIRVGGMIDDGSFPHAWLPLARDFIMAPDGSLIGD